MYYWIDIEAIGSISNRIYSRPKESNWKVPGNTQPYRFDLCFSCLQLGVGISWHLTIRFQLWGQRLDSEAIIDASRCILMQFFDAHLQAWFSKIYVCIWVCYSEFANHFLLLWWWSLKTSTDELTYLIFHKRESFCHKYDFLWVNHAIINVACIITQYI